MSEYELISLISLLRQEAAGFQWQFISIWSAYMLVVYFIGRNFPNVYIYILTLLYTVFVLVPTMGFLLAMENQYSLIELYLQSYPNSAIVSAEPINTPLIILFVNSLGWAISIVFMFHIRKAKN
jgi:hypothetical protein